MRLSLVLTLASALTGAVVLGTASGGVVTLTQTATPATPPAGQAYVFLDPGTGNISARKAAGTTVDLEAGAAGAGYATVQEEGVGAAAETKMNFIGPAVTAADDAVNTRTNVTVVASGTGACGANTWASTLTNGVAPTCTQPAFSNLSGSATDAQVPDNITISLAATATALAADPADCSGNNFALGVAASGVATCAQPAFTNLSGTSTFLATYHTLLQATGSHIAGRTAATYGFGEGDPLAISGTGTLYPLNIINIVSTDYPTINSVAPKLRVRAQVYVNDVAPTGTYIVALCPLTTPATSGGAGLRIYTLGAAVAGSAATTISAPAADSENFVVGSDFALPADGDYVLCMTSTGTVAVSSHMHFAAFLQIRNQ
jgi:hypothetical protein